jgi:hypothetical protein
MVVVGKGEQVVILELLEHHNEDRVPQSMDLISPFRAGLRLDHQQR